MIDDGITGYHIIGEELWLALNGPNRDSTWEGQGPFSSPKSGQYTANRLTLKSNAV
jgi:hypothetical protein